MASHQLRHTIRRSALTLQACKGRPLMKTLIALLASTLLLSSAALAASVETRISTHQAYVGVPITLQISISNFSDYEAAAPPAIDGCDVRSAGLPSQSTQITIINGRRRESRSVTLQYLITPRREGSFTVPAMALQVDGKAVKTQPQHFVATRSETGDLLFVAVEGSQDKVYVGQPINLTLKIWIKPFHDAETGQTLSEGDMWNLLSDSSSWGSFEPKMKELAQRRQRPGGREVLREDGTGHERVYYYLYKIDATIYPKRAGKISADDIQIVVNYPTEIAESRTTMGGLFDDDIFGNSPLSQMMRDDFFGSSFGKRLAITAARPIVGQASVNATEVLPVPSEGRPSDYRGAVGRYQIVTQATPTTVDAGDPITLNIGIVGSGAMELVQAPPLAEMPELTADFKVADESLAGFVQGDSKVFSTTIRPRQAGTKEIPAIRFSFFDPATEAFETVTSQPIPITVHAAEVLALDSIIGPTHNNPTAQPLSSSQIGPPDFTNHSGTDVLTSQAPPQSSGLSLWLLFIIVPPGIWLATAVAKNHHFIRRWVGNWSPRFQPLKKQYVAAIERAGTTTAVRDAVMSYILRSLPHRFDAGSGEEVEEVDRATMACGALRTAGLYDLAGETESWLATALRNSAEFESGAGRGTAEVHAVAGLQQLKATASDLVGKLESAIADKKQLPMHITQPRKSKKPAMGARGLPRTTLTILLALASVLAATEADTSRLAQAQPPVSPATSTAEHTAGTLATGQQTTLTHDQQGILLDEADAEYTRGLQIAKSDAADAKAAFASAAQKYQLLVDNGISNDKLFLNLGNAYLQAGSLGRAIANYEKASRLAPGNAQVRKNLAFARTQVVQRTDRVDSGSSTTGLQAALSLPRFKHAISQWAIPVLCLASVTFWGLLVLRTAYEHLPVGRYAAAALLLMLLAGGASWWSHSGAAPLRSNAVIVTSHVTLRAGDGEQFGVVATIEQAQGYQVQHLNSRGAWTQIQTYDGHVGWLPSRDLEVIS